MLLDDMSLVREFAASQAEPAFATLVERHIGLVHSAAVRQTGDPHLAEEITQAVFIILARKAPALGPKTILSAWLYRTTRYASSDALKARHRRQAREQEAYMQSTLNEPAADAWTQLAPLLDDALADLGETDRAALVLRYFENKTAREIAGALRMEEAAAQKRVARALEKLRASLVKRGVTLTVTVIAGAVAANSVQAAPAGLAVTITAAKGMAAGSSTLTIIKGTLKLMAWTKAKIAVVTGVIVLLAAGTSIVTYQAVTAARTKTALARLEGSWEGTLTVQKAQLRLALKIFKTNEVYRAAIDSIDQGAKNIPVAGLSARPNFIHAELPALGADFQATLNTDGTALAGTWKQLNLSLPLTLTKTTEPTSVPEALAADDYAPRADSDLQGEWDGALKVGKVDLHLKLKIAEPTPGTFHAQMDSLDQGARNLPVSSLTYTKPAIRFEMTTINGVFTGNLSGRSDALTGTWVQGGAKFPLTFRRASTNDQATVVEKDYGPGTKFQVQGHWKGQLAVSGAVLHLGFNIAILPDGSYEATMDSPDQGASDIPAATATFNYPNLRMEWPAIGGVYTGKLASGKLSGTWKQGKASFPLKMERGATP